MTAKLEQVKEIFLKAVEVAPDKRESFLAEKCQGDRQLRSEVEQLLQGHIAGISLVDRVVSNEETTDQSTALVFEGLRIGPYKLLEEIGEGGMGSVWVAEQSKPVRRKVAIKLIKPGMDSKAVLARFEAERQALAMMDHPNIARVFDSGMTDQGRPFFAMEYVKGVPLIEYCDNTKLSIRGRLELFMPICKAVQHAHQKGVIHRDLKPSNILICLYDGKPVPKVIDFGLAKAMHQSLTDKTLHTAHGMMVGTPLYMSPEQAESNNLDVDTRTDIYSLGVILYELLTGSTPLEKAQLKDAAVGEILRLIKEVEPPKPSTRVSASQPNVAVQRSIDSGHLTRSIRGDLDWVVMKALEKERSRRYETANGLAEDIRRHLSDEPVSAGPPSAAYRMQKFIKRNRASVMAGTVVAVALVLAVLGTTAGMIWAWNEREEADKQRTRAEQREQDAIDAVRRFGDAVANNPELKNRPELESLRKTLLQEPLEYFKSLSDQLRQDAGTRPQSLKLLGAAAFDLGELNNEIGDREAAMKSYEEALVIVEKLVRDNPSNNINLGVLATTQHRMAYLLREFGRLEESLIAFQRAQKIQEQLVRENPSVKEFQHDLAASYQNVAICFKLTGQRGQAMDAVKQALEIYERLVLDDPTNLAFQNSRAATFGTLGQFLLETGQLEESQSAFQQALDIRENLVRENPSNIECQFFLASSYNKLGQLLQKSRQHERAMAAYQRAREILKRIVRANPSVTKYRYMLAMSHYYVGDILGATGQTDQALTDFQQALEIIERLVRDHPSVTEFRYKHAVYLNNFGLRFEISQPEQALAAYQRALEIMDELVVAYPDVPDYQSELGGVLSNLATLDNKAKRFDEAIDKLTRAIKHQKLALASNAMDQQYRHFLAIHYRNLIFAANRMKDKALELEARRGQLELARPIDASITESFATKLNNIIWELVKEPADNNQPSITPNDLSDMHSVIEQFPRSIYSNTLGTAEFRMGNYQAAIDACQKSLELSSQEEGYIGDYPGDLAIITMSHFKLGNQKKAEEFRTKLDKAMTLDEFADDEECKLFLEEVNALFDQAEPEDDSDGNE